MSEPNGRSADDWFHDYCEANQRARQAEARAEKAEAMADWLAEKCAMHCHDKDRDDILCSNDTCDIQTCWGASECEWKEAARRAVAESEVKA